MPRHSGWDRPCSHSQEQHCNHAWPWKCSVLAQTSSLLTVTKTRLFHAMQVQPGGAEKCTTSQKQAQTQGVCCLPGVSPAVPLTASPMTWAAASQKRAGQDISSSRLCFNLPTSSTLSAKTCTSSIMHKYFLGTRLGCAWWQSGESLKQPCLSTDSKAIAMQTPGDAKMFGLSQEVHKI